MLKIKNLGKLNYSSSIEKTIINKVNLKSEINYNNNFIIVKKKNKFVIYDRICNHKGGRIISKNNRHFCPMHNWEFYPLIGKYKNGYKKQNIEFKETKNELIIQNQKLIPKLSKKQKNLETYIEYLNHAGLYVKSNNFNFAIDPWMIGPAFETGWWLKHKTPENWVQKINKCNFIFLSHNHSDHLHELTLSKLNKLIPVFVPAFQSDSTGLLVEKLGFSNVIRLEFDMEYQLEESNLIFSIFKSGDLREDSGLYFSNGNFESLFTVDANNINFQKYPKVDLLASSFSGGATGYPVNCENYSLTQKRQIIKKNLKNIKIIKEKKLKEIRPKFFLPYAGFFTEKLSRDKFIKKNNLKNSVKNYKKFLNKHKIELLNVESHRVYKFFGNKLIKKFNYKFNSTKDLKPVEYLKFYKKEHSIIDKKYIEDYFEKTKFTDELILFVELTESNFKKSLVRFSVNFNQKKNKFKFHKKKEFNILIKKSRSKKFLHLKVRKEAFLNTIYNKLPWENFSYGFQSRQFRNPNEYFDNFWFYFSNLYTSPQYVKTKINCNSCEKLNEYFDNLTSYENK